MPNDSSSNHTFANNLEETSNEKLLLTNTPVSRITGPVVPGAPEEPVVDIHDIQGNIFPGFNKDFQTLLGLRINNVVAAKSWLRDITPNIATVEEVLAFNRLFRSMRIRRKREARGLIATWTNIAFSFDGLNKLTSEADQFQEKSFRKGLHNQSAFLGDPTDPAAEGHPQNWAIGGPGNVPDILLIVASDDCAYLNAEVSRLKKSAVSNGMELIYEENGVAPPDNPGSEHFGFKDGISQPGVRGRLSDAPQDFLTPRYIDPKDPAALDFSKPGQPLVWPGQFVFGYPLQDARNFREPKMPPTLSPSWSRNGSFLVFRRLRQDVARFWKFAQEKAAELAAKPEFAGTTAERFAALIVGRWPSGAPIMRTAQTDDSELAKDDFANNHFRFGGDTKPASLVPIPEYSGDRFQQATADSAGIICPHAAHIRKVNPRDQTTEQGGSSDTLTRRILRRGIPFGAPLVNPSLPEDDPLQGNRGLLFLSYQTSIEHQFEFLSNDWMNDEKKPRNPGGHDLIVGQNGKPEENRIRKCVIFAKLGRSETIETFSDWVIPTGGGYFFAPSISALKNALSV